jgi:hypothetical protein
VSSATRVGLHSAVVWKRLYFKPELASRSSVGILIGPPNALECPKPMSSISTITTLGAPCGALTSERGGAFASRASSVVIALRCGSWIGSTVRSSPSSWPVCACVLVAASAQTKAAITILDNLWFIVVFSLVERCRVNPRRLRQWGEEC